MYVFSRRGRRIRGFDYAGHEDLSYYLAHQLGCCRGHYWRGHSSILLRALLCFPCFYASTYGPLSFGTASVLPSHPRYPPHPLNPLRESYWARVDFYFHRFEMKADNFCDKILGGWTDVGGGWPATPSPSSHRRF